MHILRLTDLFGKILNFYRIYLLYSLLKFIGLYIVLQLEELKNSHIITVTSTKDTTDDEDENDKLWRANGVAHRRLMDFLYSSQEKIVISYSLKVCENLMLCMSKEEGRYLLKSWIVGGVYLSFYLWLCLRWKLSL